MVTITAKKRDVNESLSRLRSSGSIPAVFYGPKEDSTPISLDYIQFNKVLSEGGESTVVSLIGDAGEHDTLIHDISREPVTGKIVHVDLYVMEKGKKVKVNIPVEFIGVSPAVKDQGAILVKVMHEIEVEALPKDLPHDLKVDISKIVDLESPVTAGDIKLPSGVTLVTGEEEIVALAKMAREEVEETAPIDLSSIEVEKKGKEESEEGAEGAEKTKK
ncbi:MAG: 50S ribosomal protein L25 [bacterium]